MSIADNIKYLRKQKNMTQKQLAKASGLAVITIQQYEAGKFEPKNDSLYKLRKALDCNIHEILDKPIVFDLEKAIYIDADNIDDFPQKFKEATGKELKSDYKIFQQNMENDLLNSYRALNIEGKLEACKRVSELTELERYTKKDEEE